MCFFFLLTHALFSVRGICVTSPEQVMMDDVTGFPVTRADGWFPPANDGQPLRAHHAIFRIDRMIGGLTWSSSMMADRQPDTLARRGETREWKKRDFCFPAIGVPHLIRATVMAPRPSHPLPRPAPSLVQRKWLMLELLSEAIS